MSVLTTLFPLVIAFASSDNGWFLPFIAGPIVGTGFYTLVFLYYRNTNKRHTFEHETVTVVTNLKTEDHKIGENNGTRNSAIDNRNSEDHLRRVRRV